MIPAGVEIFVCTSPVDMRWSFDRLSGVVRERFGREPRGGALFIFFGKRRKRPTFYIQIGHSEDLLSLASTVRRACRRCPTICVTGQRICQRGGRRWHLARDAELDAGRNCMQEHDAWYACGGANRTE
jgi:hypothetical protein